MSKMSNLVLLLAEERRWNKAMTEEEERDFMIRYSKGMLPQQWRQRKNTPNEESGESPDPTPKEQPKS